MHIQNRKSNNQAIRSELGPPCDKTPQVRSHHLFLHGCPGDDRVGTVQGDPSVGVSKISTIHVRIPASNMSFENGEMVITIPELSGVKL